MPAPGDGPAAPERAAPRKLPADRKTLRSTTVWRDPRGTPTPVVTAVKTSMAPPCGNMPGTVSILLLLLLLLLLQQQLLLLLLLLLLLRVG